MLPSLALSRHKNSGDNERSFFVDKEAVDVRTVKCFYSFVFQPELVIVFNMKKWNKKHGGIASLRQLLREGALCTPCRVPFLVNHIEDFCTPCACLSRLGFIIGFYFYLKKGSAKKKIPFLHPSGGRNRLWCYCRASGHHVLERLLLPLLHRVDEV